MDKQVIISVGRQYGSCGHIVAQRIAEKLNIDIYDRNILKDIAEKHDSDYDEMLKYDEKPRNLLFSKRRGEYNSSVEVETAKMQFDFLKEKADEGKSFVVIGRCAETVLKDYPNHISVFISADMDCRIKRVVEADHQTEREAKYTIARKDKKRRDYHDMHSEKAWGEAETYDLCLNISKMDIDTAADFIINYADIMIK